MSDKDKVNIPRSIKDDNYRYFMPRITVTVQGTGGGVKTKWDNITKIAAALTVPPDYPLKFIGRELGSQTEIKENNYLINGNHSDEKLQSILDKFIEKYVLCQKCGLPETRIFVKKGEIRAKCIACGAIFKMDDKHKFSNHIKNFPPQYDKIPSQNFRGISVGTSVGGASDNLSSASQQPEQTIDKETKEKMKNLMQNVEGILKVATDNQTIILNIDKAFDKYKLPSSLNIFCLVNGLYDKNIYPNFKRRSDLLKHVNNIFYSTIKYLEKEKNSEETMYHITAAIANLCIDRFKKDNLDKFIPSLLYVMYMDDLITEDFWVKYAIKSNLTYRSPILSSKSEIRFLELAKEFTNWIETAPYEDEEDHRGKKKEDESVSKTAKSGVSATAKAQEVDDLDIDDI